MLDKKLHEWKKDSKVASAACPPPACNQSPIHTCCMCLGVAATCMHWAWGGCMGVGVAATTGHGYIHMRPWVVRFRGSGPGVVVAVR